MTKTQFKKKNSRFENSQLHLFLEKKPIRSSYRYFPLHLLRSSPATLQEPSSGFQLHATMGQIRKKHRIKSHLIIHCPTSEGVSEVSERASERVSTAEGASKASSPEQANE